MTTNLTINDELQATSDENSGGIAAGESFNARIKAFRTQFRGVGDIRFFMYRLSMLYG